MKIQIILGSTRPNRIGERVAKWVDSVAEKQAGFETELVDLADYGMPLLDEPVSPRFNPSRQPNEPAARWLAKLSEADGYVIVTPEYNHSIPGVLKNAFDYLDFQVAKKPAAIVSYGTVGGARAAEHLKGILIESKMAVVPEAVALMNAAGQISETGEWTGDSQSAFALPVTLANVLAELAWWTTTLKAGRERAVASR